MTSEVNEYLQVAATPEYQALALQALAVFDDFDYTEHEQDLLNAVMAGGTAEESSVVQDIHFTLVQHCQELLGMHHIALVEDASLELMTQILRALYLMQAWEDPVALQKLLEQDADPEEIFADIVHEVVGLDVTAVTDNLVDFDDAVNKRLSQILQGSLPEDDQQEDDVGLEQITRLRNYSVFINNNKLIGLRLIRLGYRVGAPFENYYHKVKRHFDTMEPEVFAQEIIPLLLMGRDTWTSPSQSFNDLKGRFELDLDVVSKIDILIRDQWTKFQRFIPS